MPSPCHEVELPPPLTRSLKEPSPVARCEADADASRSSRSRAASSSSLQHVVTIVGSRDEVPAAGPLASACCSSVAHHRQQKTSQDHICKLSKTCQHAPCPVVKAGATCFVPSRRGMPTGGAGGLRAPRCAAPAAAAAPRKQWPPPPPAAPAPPAAFTEQCPSVSGLSSCLLASGCFNVLTV